jgi:hypothetical protein
MLTGKPIGAKFKWRAAAGGVRKLAEESVGAISLQNNLCALRNRSSTSLLTALAKPNSSRTTIPSIAPSMADTS